MIEKENIMPLHLQNDFTPHIRWMAQSSTWRKSAPDGHEPVTWEHAIFDLSHIQTGWGIFAEGQAPEWVMDPSLKVKAPKPADGREWRRGFKVSMFSESAFGGVREFSTTAVGAVRGINALYDQYEAETEQHFNQVPVVQYCGATAARIGKGNTSIPNFRIVQWRDRPAAMPFNDGLPEQLATRTPAAQPAATPARPTRAEYQDHQAPLAPAPVPQPTELAKELDDAINL